MSEEPRFELWIGRLLRLFLVVLVAVACFFLWRISMAAYQIEKMLAANQEEIHQVVKTAAAISEKLDAMKDRIERLEARAKDLLPVKETEALFEEMGEIVGRLRSEEVPKAASVEEEIEFLLGEIGGWGGELGYGDKEVSARRLSFLIRSKYRLKGKGISTAEDFIREVATETINGKRYFVVDENGGKVPFDEWLRARLESFRSGETGNP